MGNDKSIVERITEMVKEIVHIAADAADQALKPDEHPVKAADERAAALHPAGRRWAGRQSHDGGADRRCVGAEEEARRSETGRKSRQKGRSEKGGEEKGRQEICEQGREETGEQVEEGRYQE